MGFPSVSFAKAVSLDGGTAKVERQTEAGYDEVECPLPAVLSLTAGVVEPRYPSFKGIMAAKSKPVDTLTVAISASMLPTSVGLELARKSRTLPPLKNVRPAKSLKTMASRTRRSWTSWRT